MRMRVMVMAMAMLVGAVVTPSGVGAAEGDEARGADGGEAWGQIASLFVVPEEFRGDLGAYRPVLRFEDGRAVETAEQWRERRQELLRAWHGLMGPWPKVIDKPGVRILESRRVDGYTRHKVELESAPGRVAPGYLCVPDGEGPFAAVVTVFYEPESAVGLNAKVASRSIDFGSRLAERGFVTLNIGMQPGLDGPIYYPDRDTAQLQPLSFLAYVAANGYQAVAAMERVDAERVGIVGHSYGGKWSLFAGALWEKFAAVAVSDPGIVFDESRPNVNYWEPWYLGHEPGAAARKRGVPRDESPRTGAYAKMIEGGRDLHELHALIAPRPLLISGGSEDPPDRWRALNHAVAVNRLLGHEARVGMSNRPRHAVDVEAHEQICAFFEHFLKR